MERLHQLTPDQQPRWGRMDAGRMLAHLTDACRMATGDLAVAPRKGPLRYWPLRDLVIYYLPWPKGAPTAPELVRRRRDEVVDGDVAGALADVVAAQRASGDHVADGGEDDGAPAADRG